MHFSIALCDGVHYMHLWPVASLLSPSLTPVISHHPLHSTALQHHHPCRHPQPLSVGLYPVITFVASQGSLHWSEHPHWHLSWRRSALRWTAAGERHPLLLWFAASSSSCQRSRQLPRGNSHLLALGTCHLPLACYKQPTESEFTVSLLKKCDHCCPCWQLHKKAANKTSVDFAKFEMQILICV